jgi:hypothetical protein
MHQCWGVGIADNFSQKVGYPLGLNIYLVGSRLFRRNYHIRSEPLKSSLKTVGTLGTGHIYIFDFSLFKRTLAHYSIMRAPGLMRWLQSIELLLLKPEYWILTRSYHLFFCLLHYSIVSHCNRTAESQPQNPGCNIYGKLDINSVKKTGGKK